MKVWQIIGIIEADGWQLVSTRGSHRQYEHPRKPGRVTIPGKRSDDSLPRATLHGHLTCPGCVATGASIDECEAEMRDAIAFHLEGLAEDGGPIPDGSGPGVYVERTPYPAA